MITCYPNFGDHQLEIALAHVVTSPVMSGVYQPAENTGSTVQGKFHSILEVCETQNLSEMFDEKMFFPSTSGPHMWKAIVVPKFMRLDA